MCISYDCKLFLLLSSVDIEFNREACLLLADEIDEMGESLSLKIVVCNCSDSEAIAEGMVEIWIMIEDSINIARQV